MYNAVYMKLICTCITVGSYFTIIKASILHLKHFLIKVLEKCSLQTGITSLSIGSASASHKLPLLKLKSLRLSMFPASSFFSLISCFLKGQ